MTDFYLYSSVYLYPSDLLISILISIEAKIIRFLPVPGNADLRHGI